MSEVVSFLSLFKSTVVSLITGRSVSWSTLTLITSEYPVLPVLSVAAIVKSYHLLSSSFVFVSTPLKVQGDSEFV